MRYPADALAETHLLQKLRCFPGFSYPNPEVVYDSKDCYELRISETLALYPIMSIKSSILGG